MVFPSLSELSTIYCDPHSEKLAWSAMVHKAQVDFFLELSCFFDDPEDVGNLISGSSAFSKAEHVEVHGSHIAESSLGEF